MPRSVCHGCGAWREPAETRCPYCGRPYPKEEPVAVPDLATVKVAQTTGEASAILEALAWGTLSPNEARALLGLPLR